MVIDPLNADRLWVAQTSRQDANSGNTFSSGLLLSEDGGFSWTTLFRGLVSDFAADPSDGNTFLLGVPRNDGGTGGAGVYRSTDAGRTWTQVFAGRGAFPRFTFAFSPASPSRVTMHAFMENAGRMHASDDGGRTWTELSAAPPEGRTSFLAAHPSRPDQLYLGYPGSDLQVSIDSCASWQNVTRNRDANGRFDPTQSLTHIDQHALVFSPADERVLYLANDGGLYRSTDGGGSFTSLNGTLSLVQAYGIAAHPSDPAMLFLGTQDNGLERRTDGEWRELITGDYGSILFDANNPGNIVSNYVFGTILAFGGNGSTYLDERTSSATFGETEPYRIQFIAPFERHPRTNELYFGTWKLHVSADFGRTWTAMAGGLDLTHGISDTLSAIGLARNDPGVLYTGSAMGRVMRSRDGGATWVSVTNGLPSRYVKALHVDPRDGNRVWVAFSGYRSAHVYRTLDGGATWQALSSGLPDVPVNALLLDPDSPDRVYAGTDIGVFILEGEAWRHLGEGMPPVVVTRFAVTADGRIVAATYGRGAYELVAGEPTRRRRVRH
jgi:photosystem II stability/assembly factor-like uncharacterized protein